MIDYTVTDEQSIPGWAIVEYLQTRPCEIPIAPPIGETLGSWVRLRPTPPPPRQPKSRFDVPGWAVREYQNHTPEPFTVHASAYDGRLPKWVFELATTRKRKLEA